MVVRRQRRAHGPVRERERASVCDGFECVDATCVCVCTFARVCVAHVCVRWVRTGCSSLVRKFPSSSPTTFSDLFGSPWVSRRCAFRLMREGSRCTSPKEGQRSDRIGGVVSTAKKQQKLPTHEESPHTYTHTLTCADRDQAGASALRPSLLGPAALEAAIDGAGLRSVSHVYEYATRIQSLSLPLCLLFVCLLASCLVDPGIS